VRIVAARRVPRIVAARGTPRTLAGPRTARISAARRIPRVFAGPDASQRGQASVEFVALLPLIVLVLFAGWQLLLAGDALWNARAAARAAARAQAVGDDPREAARDHLPAPLERGLRVTTDADGDVRVSVRIPAVIRALDVGRVAATGHFERQGP
jgi:Flp pilus assembly protein TadG